ncbi:cell division protein FtsL [Olsenella uli]|uniref:cell division protein FtsL n=1 Tax=Olsenella uli TaxID=133926 RepID=UPI001958CFF0|nr:cell division protein FtsL [Olsenella uli]MBM6817388.1 cell division protein FtsL [Olsenella uli]
MRYQGSEAYAYDAATEPRRRERASQEPLRSFEVVPGGGLDARARRGVSPQFVARVRAAVAVAALVIALGLVRVVLSSATVAVLEQNASLAEQIESAQTLSTDLRVERSVLSSNARISRIATQNYGMTLPSERLTVDLGDGAEGQGAPEAGEAPADGEAAQPTDATGGNAAVD